MRKHRFAAGVRAGICSVTVTVTVSTWLATRDAEAAPPPRAAMARACESTDLVEKRTSDPKAKVMIGDKQVDLAALDPYGQAVLDFCEAEEKRKLPATTGTMSSQELDREAERAYIAALREDDALHQQAFAITPLIGAFVDKAIQGTAALVADRAQAELALWLVTDFSRKLCAEKESGASGPARLRYGEWFPETCAVAKEASEQPSGMLASAFRADLEALPFEMLGDVLGLIGGDAVDSRKVAKLVVGVIVDVQDGKPLGDALAERIRKTGIACAYDNDVACGIVMASILADVGRDLIGADGRVTRDDVLALLAKTQLLEVLKEKIVVPYTTAPAEAPTHAAPKGTPFGALVELLRLATEAGDVDAGAQLAADALLPRFGTGPVPAIVAVLQAGATLAKSTDAAVTEGTTEARQAAMLAGTDLAVSLFELSFQAASKRAPDHEKVLASTSSAVKHFIRREWQEGGRDVLRVLVVVQAKFSGDDPKSARKDALKVLSRTLTFVVDAADADTPEEFKAALDSAAAPLGGWRRKTEGFVASFGAMAGVTGGLEILLEGDKRPAGYVAPLAMLGLDLAWPVRKRAARRSSLGLFFSAIDVGQLASQRIFSQDQANDLSDPEDSGVEDKPNLGIAQVLSPGAYVRLGIVETPITFLLGASAVPDLRRGRDTPDADAYDAWALHIGLGIAVDVTLFPMGRRVKRRAATK